MEKIIKTIGIACICIISLFSILIAIVLIKNFITSRTAWLSDDYYTEFQSDSELEKKYAGLGTYEVSSIVTKSDDTSIKNYRIWYPSDLEKEEREWPLIVVVNASNIAALNYEAYFARLASWGFIVAGNDDRQSGTGVSASKTLETVLGFNKDEDSIFNKKVSQVNIGITGYSQGGAGAINAVTAFDNSYKFKTIFTGSAAYAFLSQNMGWGYNISQITIPYFMTAGTGTSDDTGARDITSEFAGVSPLASLVENYEGITDDVFKIRARVTDAEHEDMQLRTDGYMTAWMLYQLLGDDDASKVFLGENAEILNNSNWQDIEKNK